MVNAIKPTAIYAGYTSPVVIRRHQRAQIAKEEQELKEDEEEVARGYVLIKKEEENDGCKFIKNEENEDCILIKKEEEEELDMESEDETCSEDEDDALPLDKKSLEAVISNPRASIFNKSLAREILSAHLSRTMTRIPYGGAYRRYVCDKPADGVVYDRRIGAVVKRIVPSPIGTFHVYDRLHGNIRGIRMLDGEIRKNEGIQLRVAEREMEAGHLYVPFDIVEEMEARPIHWNNMQDDMNLDDMEIDMNLEDIEDDMDFDDSEDTNLEYMTDETDWDDMEE